MKAPAMPPPLAPMRARSTKERLFIVIWGLGRVLEGAQFEEVEAKNGIGVRAFWGFGVAKWVKRLLLWKSSVVGEF